MTSNDGAGKGRDGCKRVHHTGPVAKLLLCKVSRVRCGVGAVENVADRRRRETNDHTREDTENDAEGDSVGL